MFLNIVVIWGLFGASIAFFPPAHELMTPEERMETFHTDEVPIYEVIPIAISKLHKRSSSPSQILLSMRAFGNNITILCNKNEGTFAGKNTPIYTVDKKVNTTSVKKLTTIGKLELYENLPTGASLTVCESRNKKEITGVIRSQQFAIRSLPDRIVDKITRHRRSINNISHIEGNNYQYYLAIKIPGSSDIIYNYKERTKRDDTIIKSIIYPEILVILDYDLYQKLYQNETKAVVPYILSFWHAVDLMYRTVVEPEIKLNIAGIVIAKHPNVLDYLLENKIQQKRKFSLNVNPALRSMGKWLYNYKNNISLNSYDVAFTMTPNNLCWNSCSNPINGLAFTSRACNVNEIEHQTLRVGIILNKGAYDRIDTAAHELGHLLGAKHDEENVNCSSSRLMMTESGGSRNSVNWSMCTLKSFSTFLRSNTASCLYNKPNPGEILPTFLPGTFTNADQQCKKLGYVKSCLNSRRNVDMCTQLQCLRLKHSKTFCKSIGSPAATGTVCGEGKICFQLECIDKNDLKY